MKVDDFAYRVSLRTMQLLEEKQHYKIPEDARKQITQQILQEVNTLLQGA